MAPHGNASEDQQGVQQLREWADKQPHLPKIPDRLLAQMLHSCYGSVERTKISMDNYITITSHAPDVFMNRAAFDQRHEKGMDVLCQAPLKEFTPEGYRVILFKFRDPDPAKFDMVAAVHTALVAFSVICDEDHRIPGYSVLFDFAGITMTHIMKVSLTCLKQLLVFVQEGLPCRLKGIHFIKSIPLVQHVVNLVKPLMKKELIEIFFVHTEEEMGQFYDKYVPQSIMPEEYGGAAGKAYDLHTELWKRVLNSKEYLRSLDSLVVDESKRSGKSKSSSDIFGIQGSFKKLDLD